MPRPNKFEQAFENLRAALWHPDLSEDFYFFNDDFFVMEPLQDLPVVHRGWVSDRIAEGGGGDTYRHGRSVTQNLLKTLLPAREDLLSYEAHAPMEFNTEALRAVLDLIGRHLPTSLATIAHWKTVYGNLAALGGRYIESPKAGGPPWPTPFMSTEDTAFEGEAGDYIRGLFPDPSPYEGDQCPAPPSSPTSCVELAARS